MEAKGKTLMPDDRKSERKRTGRRKQQHPQITSPQLLGKDDDEEMKDAVENI